MDVRRVAIRSAVAGLFLAIGCGTSVSYRAAEDGDGNGLISLPAEPCTDGVRYPCGITLGEHDGVADCMEGTRLCTGGLLGTCEPTGTVTTKSLGGLAGANDGSGLATRALGSSTNCASNPCNPYCRTFDDSPDGALDGGCGLAYDDAGAIVLGDTPCALPDAASPDSGAPALPCGPHQIRCGGVCVTPKTDPNHCGACGNVCASGQACSAGVCMPSCQAPLTKCGRLCVDRSVDNDNCGACGTVCGAGKGCSAGVCRTAVSLAAPPAKCVNGGPPIRIASTSGPVDCAGNLAERTFQRAICSCSDFTTVAGTILTDGFDSRVGPYASGGLGAGFGSNGKVTGIASYDIGGEAVIGNGYTNTASAFVAREGLKCNGAFSSMLATNRVTGNAYVNGNASLLLAALNVTGNYYAPAGASTPSAGSIGGSIVRGPVSIQPPCPCGAGEAVPAASIVAAHVTDNDNALIGLAPNAMASGGRLDLPCGHYYLSSIGATLTGTTIVTHGNTALYIGGDINATIGVTEIEPDPTSNLDVFIAGNINVTIGTLRFGNPNYPGQMRVYFGGSNFNLTVSTGTVYVAANVDGPSATFTSAVGGAVVYGSLYGNVLNQLVGSLSVHHDRSVHEASATCQVTPVPATFSRVFASACGPGEKTRWGLFTYDTYDPAGTNVTFTAKTATTEAGLESAASTNLAVAGYAPVGSTTPADPAICMGACTVDLGTKVVPNHLPILRLDATLNPSATLSPALRGWNVTYSCVPAE